MKPSLLIKNVLLYTCKQNNNFSTISIVSKFKKTKLSRLLYVEVFHKIMHKEFLNKLQLAVMKNII